jgi:uncharacterized protein DUF4384
MRRTLFLALAFALSAPGLLTAQSIYLNDNQAKSWTDDSPRVRVWFDGPRSVPNGAPMRVRFEVSDNAFVTVVRVDDNGRMTVLFPRSRNQRAAVRANQIYFANNPRLGSEISFVSTGTMGGYVFALASYAPLDFSRFEYRDFERIGGWSTFTQVNRPIARRPDVFIDRFAAAVLWDKDTPYDYDVDYYFPTGYSSSIASAYSYCGSMFTQYGAGAYGGFPQWAWDDWDLMPYPYHNMCRSWYAGVQCFTYLPINSYTGCSIGQIVQANPTKPVDQPADTAGGGTPNEGVIRGGLFGPTPIPVIPVGSDPAEAERAVPRFDQVKGMEAGRGNEWDNIMSIPARATRKMKEEDARRAGNADAAAPARTFDRADVTTGKSEKSRTADASNAAPPSREPTKVKSTGETRPDRNAGSTVRTATGYGTSSTGRSDGPDRVNRPADTKPAGTTSSPNPPSLQGTTGDKKKPPTS